MGSHWTVRILCEDDVDHCLAIRGDKVVTTFIDNRDKFQYWIKEERQSLEDEDEDGPRSLFTLVNYATGVAILDCAFKDMLSIDDYKHDPDSSDGIQKVAVWSMSNMNQRGFHCICKADNMFLMIIVRGIADGAPTILGEQDTSCSFMWKIVPVREKMLDHHPISDSTIRGRQPLTKEKTVRIYNFLSQLRSHSLTMHNDIVMLAPSNPRDKYQHWIKDTAYAEHIKDAEGNKCFALVNKATSKAMSHGFGPHSLLTMVEFNPRYLDPAILWTEARHNSEGFRELRMLTNSSAVLDAYVSPGGTIKSLVAVWATNGGPNQL